jgi:hypothetical protein
MRRFPMAWLHTSSAEMCSAGSSRLDEFNCLSYALPQTRALPSSAPFT